MIRDLRRILLTIARGGCREPGEICSIPNYITPPGTPIEYAIFVPPSPLMVMDARSNREIYRHSEKKALWSGWQSRRINLN